MKSSLRWTLMLLCIMPASTYATGEGVTDGSTAAVIQQTKKMPPLKKVASTAAGALNEAMESAVPWRVGTYLIDKFLDGCKFVKLKAVKFTKGWVGKINTTRALRTLCKATGIILVAVFIYNFFTKLFADEAPPQVSIPAVNTQPPPQPTFTISEPVQ